MYITEIAWLLSWPVFIFISYRIALVAIEKFEKNVKEE